MNVAFISDINELPEAVLTREGDYFEYLLHEGVEITLLFEGGSYSALLSDGEYQVFISPRLAEGDEDFIPSLYSFAVDSELSLSIIDVAPDELPALIRGTRACKITGDGESFTVRVENELSSITEMPEVMVGDVYLSEPVEKFSAEYKRLVTDKELNAYWGNDLRVDMVDSPSEFFTEEARAEFDSGISLTSFALSLSEEGENLFVGEGVLYRFDYRGGCEVGVRVLPEYQGRGFGSMILEGIIRIAQEIGVLRAYARVFNENTAAIKTFGKQMECRGTDGGVTYFEKEF